MRAAHAALAALVVAVTLVAVAAAGPTAAKKRVAFELEMYPDQTFVLVPLTSGLKGDSGTIVRIPESEGREVLRDGQRLTIYDATWPLKGKRGSVTIRERNEWAFLGSNVNNDRFEDAVAFGTWKIVRGTGQYAGVTGGGRSAHAGLGNNWNARYEGLVTTP